MKKKFFALLLAAALVVAVVALTACSAKEETPDEPATTVAAVEETPTEAPANITDAPNVPAANLADLVAEQNAAMEAVNAASGGTCTIEVKADGDKLVYAYTYAMELPAEALQASLDAAAQAYGGQIGAFKDAGYGISAIVIQFLDQSGKELASKEFK
jgi:cytoskeletal protein RodZ